MLVNETPTYDTLRAHRLTCLLGVESATRCLTMEELRTHWTGYERRRAQYAAALAIVDAQIAALVQDVYPPECRTAFRTLVLARRAGQITPREFGMRARWLRR